MGLKLTRKKPKNIKLSLAYKINKFLPIQSDSKLKLYLDLAWIFSRLAHEQTLKSSVKLAYKPEADFLLNYLKADDYILDVGCGSGHVIKRLLNKTKNIVGIDYQQSAIKCAKQKYGKQVTLICDDVFNYLHSHKNLTFDVIVLSHVLEHVDNPQDFLKTLVGMSNYIYIEVPDFEVSHLNLFREKTNTDLVYSDADHVCEFDREELSKIILNSNLEVVDTEFKFGVMKFWCKKQPK